jgi:PhoPQ-activated pathogenicity-related protein
VDKIREKMDNIVFVYRKDDKIKCLPYSAKNIIQENELMSNGWKHIATIDPCKAIETMYNEKKSAKKYLK